MLPFLTISCFLIVAYTYIFYPLLLKVWASFKKDNEVCYSREDDLPGISIIMAAYNEELVIGSKIQSILQSNYPLSKMEILIGSDNSSDNTDEIISGFANEHPFIKLHRFTTRTGKTGIINSLVLQSKFPILILTDANVLFDVDTLFQLTRHFKNESIALVDSRMINTGIRSQGISLQEKTYIEAEVYIKHAEGRIWGTMMGPFGGCYAMRKSYFHAVPANFLVDDFYINMKALLAGGRCINEIQACAYEEASNNPSVEFSRKVRIAAGSFQNLFHFLPALFKPGASAFCFLSHKVLRWLGPFFILGFFIGSVLMRHHLLYAILMWGTVAVFSAPLVDYLFRRLFNLHFSLLKYLSHFATANIAQVAGLFRYLRGIRSGIWQPTARRQ